MSDGSKGISCSPFDLVIISKMCRKDRKDREAKKLSDLKNVFFYAQLTGNVRLACIRQKINLDHTNGCKSITFS